MTFINFVFTLMSVLVLIAAWLEINDRRKNKMKLTRNIRLKPKKIYASTLEEKLYKRVISREEYEWKKSERMGLPIR